MSSPTASSSPLKIYGMGNPLLDISAPVNQQMLDKYEVQLNNAVLAEAKHLPVYEELINNYPVEYIAGGATQNSIRVAQWMLQHPGATTYVGSVGRDKYGAQLRESAQADGVKVLYQETDEHPTGTCACLIVHKDRSLIAHLGAANHFKVDHLKTESVRQAIEESDIFYSAGFFLTVSPPSLMEIAEHVHQHAGKKTLCVNLSAPFIPQFFNEPLMAAIHAADYVFGNESEAEALAQKMGWEDSSAGAVALKIAALPKKNENRPRVAVITQGPKHTNVAFEGKLLTFDVPTVPAEEIVDANGAGDAFVGGFLSQLAIGAPLEQQIKAAHYAARVILGRSGTELSGKPNPKFEKQ